LITLLWGLKNDALDKPGYGDLIAMLAAGRTSIVTDPAFERTFYKLAGFRFLGKRAVRIDILERLSDLIRPALQWNPGAGTRPEGGYDGRRFTTTPGMLSILGATQDDIEEILKGLGYRADAVPAEEAAAHLAELDLAETARQAEAAAEAAPAGEADGAAAPADAQAQPAPAETPSDDTAVSPAADGEAEGQPQAVAPASSSDADPAAQAARPDGAAEAPETAAIEAAPAEATGEPAPEDAPKPVLLWRPLGRHEQARGRHQHGHGANGNGQGRRGGKPNGKAAQGKGGKPAGRGFGNGNGKHDNAHRGDRHDHRHTARPPRREKPIDPDSPFAKLAALKEQLEK
jgi:ATP-dependent RNA helicase SUPV3L1/SUV3